MISQQTPVSATKPAASKATGLLTLFGEGHSSYQTSKHAFAFSYVGNILVIAVLVWSSHWVIQHSTEIKQRLTGELTPLVLPPAPTAAGGGGGGGDLDRLAATRGAPPKFALEQLAPPAVVVRNDHPLLAAEPTVLGPPQIQLASQTAAIGDPLSVVVASLSNGTGKGGGIGDGIGTGVGSGRGAGVGPGHGGGIGGDAYKPGLGGVTAPRTLYAPDPQYSDQARSAKFQGSVLLWLVVGADGVPRDIKIVRSVGLGLDERAMDAVRSWKFDPGRKDGQPVATQINVEVSFRLY
jgi:protein TonB